MLNVVAVQGRLTRDPELRRTQEGKAVCSFSVAVQRNMADKVVDYIDCVAFGQTAEFLPKYFQKGKELTVQGRLQTRTWTDKEGKNRKSVEVFVDLVNFCGSKAQQANEFVPVDVEEGELPF